MSLLGRRVQAVLLLGSILLMLVAIVEGNTLIAVGWAVVAALHFLGTWRERANSQGDNDPIV
jgi:hypothetical protein